MAMTVAKTVTQHVMNLHQNNQACSDASNLLLMPRVQSSKISQGQAAALSHLQDER